MVENTTTIANCHIHVITAIASETAFFSKADSSQQGRAFAQYAIPYYYAYDLIKLSLSLSCMIELRHSCARRRRWWLVVACK